MPLNPLPVETENVCPVFPLNLLTRLATVLLYIPYRQRHAVLQHEDRKPIFFIRMSGQNPANGSLHIHAGSIASIPQSVREAR